MTRLFMLEFRYGGERFFANVIEYRHSPAIYFVNLINAPQVRPRKLIFDTIDGKIVLSPDSLPAKKEMVDAICKGIEDFVKNN